MEQGAVPTTLNAWLGHLETLHPQKIDLELLRVRTVAERLELLPATVPTITVAGTNGKGTCVAALAALLSTRGYSVGCYTSPHLLAFNERITVNQQPATDADIMAAFATIENQRKETSLSYFEFATLAALYLFKQKMVDFQILEVGLGGRLDAVNIVDADACVITSIGIDHTEWLGDTRELIAVEKAGVARHGRPVVVAEEDPPSTLRSHLEGLGAIGYWLGEQWTFTDSWLRLPDSSRRELPSVPALQPSNLGAAVTVLSILGLGLEQEEISNGLAGLMVPGRRQVLRFADRSWWFDVAHNQEAVAKLAEALATSSAGTHTHAIFGAMADKPLRAMIDLMVPGIASWHLPEHQGVTRAATSRDLESLIVAASGQANVHCHGSPGAAFDAVQALSEPGDRILVFGSFITVGAQLECLGQAQSGRETLN